MRDESSSLIIIIHITIIFKFLCGLGGHYVECIKREGEIESFRNLKDGSKL